MPASRASALRGTAAGRTGARPGTALQPAGRQALDGGYERVFGTARGVVARYRLRAGVTGRARLPAGVYRYDWPSPHQSFAPAVVFGDLRCNGGMPIPLNPLRNEPYLRALVHGMARGRLPASRRFVLRPGPRTGPGFNGLPGVRVPVPRTDRDGQPIGGVRFPEVELPLGRLEPVSIPPTVTTGSAQVCGNSGGYTPFSAAEVARRYSRADYLARYRRALASLQRARLVLGSERAAMLAAADADYRAAVGDAP